MIELLLNIDRRIIFALVFLAVIIPLWVKIDLPFKPTATVLGVYDRIESLPENSVVLLSSDYDPQSRAELFPMHLAVLRHCFRKNLKVISMTHWIYGVGIAEEALKVASNEYNKKNGEDYVFLGWKPGFAILIIGMGQDLYDAFPTDHYGKNTREIPMLKNVSSLRDINYLVDLAAGNTIEPWIAYGRDIYGFEMGAGCTAIIAPDMYPFLQTKQITGLLGGMKGAADYEILLKQGTLAQEAMRPLTAVHILIVVLVLLCNILYFITRKKDGRKKQ
ncbi:MAG: hypothetical protein QME51_05700 [Planctomycetota bacterium]|nr:hypothetical protein [Planctomycetota bacterium]MDI6787846.1 hypothetical protein [Planctomycetota bacterium]